MKIYILPIDEKLRPKSQPFSYPNHNSDYGVEQDFYNYLVASENNLTDNPSSADFHYLPVYWTRWHLNHDYGKTGIDEMQRLVDEALVDSKKTFTVCQYDDGPSVNLGGSIVYLASRKNESNLDIPLLSSPHKKPIFKKNKKYLASFIGRVSTHPLREKMVDALLNRKDILIKDGNKGTSYFVNQTLSSYVALAPRGYGGSSFRFFEAMQLGVVPFLIGDYDTRPFKSYIDWDSCSFYTNDASKIEKILDSHSIEDLLLLGKNSQEVFQSKLNYKKWCNYLLLELEKKFL
jgi:hypothetical protein